MAEPTSNSLSKTLAPSDIQKAELTRRQLLAGAALTAGSLALTRVALGQGGTPAVSRPIPSAFAVRLGEVFPALSARQTLVNLPWESTDLLGQRSLFLILDGPKPLYKYNEGLLNAGKKAHGSGATVAVVSPPRPQTEVLSAPEPFLTLTSDKLAALPPAPALVAIDKAGWVREVELLPGTALDKDPVRLSYLLAKIGDPTPTFEEGKTAPDFAFQDFRGVPRRVSALRGRRNLVITFFPKCFTGRCKTQLSALRDSEPNFLAADTEVWAVSVDPADGERGQIAFAEYINLPYPMLPDTGRNVCMLYGAAQSTNQLALRQTVLIDKDGLVRWIDRAIVPDTHGQDVLLKMKGLGMA